MSSPVVELTDVQEQRLQAVDREVDSAMHEVQAWLSKAPPDRPATAGMTAEERTRYQLARTRLRTLTDEREALRAKLYAERAEELRREHLAGTVADQELNRAAARAARESQSSAGFGGVLGRIFRRR